VIRVLSNLSAKSAATGAQRADCPNFDAPFRGLRSPDPGFLQVFAVPLASLTAAGSILSFLVLSGLGVLLLRARRRLAATTLATAWWWMAAVWSLWSLTAGWLLVGTPSRETAAQLLYWTGIVSLCPGIAVLGAKRPGSRVWNLFILIPLLLVLGWPAVTVWRLDGPRLFAAEIPVLAGLGLVLVMGTGNYLGTRYGMAALCYGLAVLAVIAPVTVLFPAQKRAEEAAATPQGIFLLATVLLGVSGTLAWRAARTPPGGTRGTTRLWSDFREAFGVVWGKRLQDRLNQEAVRENWGGVVGFAGLEWPEASVATAEDRLQVEKRFEHHLLWLLRRFVDRSWIDERTDLPAEAVVPTTASSTPATSA